MNIIWLVAVIAEGVGAFQPHVLTERVKPLFAYETTVNEELLDHKLEGIGKKLRLQLYDPNTGVYGIESKDPLYGIENIRADIPIDPSIGLELTEVAHDDYDHRGLVLVSKVSGNAAEHSSIKVGDVIIGVFQEDAGFKESVTGMDFETTQQTIEAAKMHAHLMAFPDVEAEGAGAHISFDVNRLVPRAKVKVVVEDGTHPDRTTTIDGLAGDNLRLLLMHNKINLYDKNTRRLDQPHIKGENCGGEAICGTCMVKILEGQEALKPMGPQELDITTGRPSKWRAACQTVVGHNNKESTIRIRVHPQYFVDHE